MTAVIIRATVIVFSITGVSRSVSMIDVVISMVAIFRINVFMSELRAKAVFADPSGVATVESLGAGGGRKSRIVLALHSAKSGHWGLAGLCASSSI
jgi:hypothetical protein